MTVRAADDFAAIRARLVELQRERETFAAEGDPDTGRRPHHAQPLRRAPDAGGRNAQPHLLDRSPRRLSLGRCARAERDAAGAKACSKLITECLEDTYWVTWSDIKTRGGSPSREQR
jgi:hypothetical protein